MNEITHTPPRERERHTPPRDYPPRGEREYNTPPRDSTIFRGSVGGIESNGESSGASSYDPHHIPPQQVSTHKFPTLNKVRKNTLRHQHHLDNSISLKVNINHTESPLLNQMLILPAVYAPRVPPKPAMNTFVTRPATPPGSDFDQKPKVKESKMKKFKRFSGLGRSKS